MIELLVLILGIAALVIFKVSLKNTAVAVEMKTMAWSEDVKASAITDISQVELTQDTVDKAQQVLNLTRSIKY